MKFTKFGHSCFLIEEGEAKILVDPGSYSSGFESLTDLDAILITHNHPDHMTPEIIQSLLVANAGTVILADEASAGDLAKAGVAAKAVHDGDREELGGLKIEVIGTEHAEIHPSLPRAKNVGYRISDSFFFPGDALTVPIGEIKVLALPLVAPWSKVAETIDYLMAVKPNIAIPVHDAILAKSNPYAQILERFAVAQNIEFRIVENGIMTEL